MRHWRERSGCGVLDIHTGVELDVWLCPFLADGLSCKLLNCFELQSCHLCSGKNPGTYTTALWKRS